MSSSLEDNIPRPRREQQGRQMRDAGPLRGQLPIIRVYLLITRALLLGTAAVDAQGVSIHGCRNLFYN